MENAQVKVNSEQCGATMAGLQCFTDEQLAKEMRRRGYEVTKWDDEQEWPDTDSWPVEDLESWDLSPVGGWADLQG